MILLYDVNGRSIKQSGNKVSISGVAGSRPTIYAGVMVTCDDAFF